jgi:hypothetical protein
MMFIQTKWVIKTNLRISSLKFAVDPQIINTLSEVVFL